MPTKKPIVQIVLEQKYFDKLKIIATENDRKTSDQGRRIIEKFIDEYEQNNGTININIGRDNNGTINI